MALKPNATKAKANATTTKATPAPKVEATANTPKPETAQDTTTPAVELAGTTAAAVATVAISDEDAAKFRAEGYASGYSDGFSEALDGQATGEGDTQESAGDGNEYAQPDYDQIGVNRDTVAIIALALMTPEPHRKGGLAPMVKRIGDFIATLDTQHRDAAFVFMQQIALTKPQDLATGRFALTVNEAIGVLTGGAAPTLPETATSNAAAAARFAQAFPQEDETEKLEDVMPQTDPTDPHSPAAAAGRLSQAL